MRRLLAITLVLVTYGLAYGDWFFDGFDSNHDGYVSEKEFPGSAEAFRTLDTNGDGLIGPEEAPKAPDSSAGTDLRAVVVAPGVVRWIPRGAAVRRAYRYRHGVPAVNHPRNVPNPAAAARRRNAARARVPATGVRRPAAVPHGRPAPARRRPHR